MNKSKIIKFVFFLLIFSFFVLLFAEKIGYYSNKTNKAKALTEEQIKIFEQDIKDGKEINIEEYVINKTTNYSTDLSNSLYKVSLELEGCVDKVIKFIFKKASEVIEK